MNYDLELEIFVLSLQPLDSFSLLLSSLHLESFAYFFDATLSVVIASEYVLLCFSLAKDQVKMSPHRKVFYVFYSVHKYSRQEA